MIYSHKRLQYCGNQTSLLTVAVEEYQKGRTAFWYVHLSGFLLPPNSQCFKPFWSGSPESNPTVSVKASVFFFSGVSFLLPRYITGLNVINIKIHHKRYTVAGFIRVLAVIAIICLCLPKPLQICEK